MNIGVEALFTSALGLQLPWAVEDVKLDTAKRRGAIEQAIGHMKMGARLARNPLKGALGDALHAVMCGAGHSLRLILAALRLCCARFGLSIQAVIAALLAASHEHQPVCG